MTQMPEQITSGFTQAGVYARRQFCVDLEVYRPPEPLWNPRLREAATTLCKTERRRRKSLKMSGRTTEIIIINKYLLCCFLNFFIGFCLIFLILNIIITVFLIGK